MTLPVPDEDDAEEEVDATASPLEEDEDMNTLHDEIAVGCLLASRL